MLVGLICPLTKGKEGRFDDTNYPLPQHLLKPRKPGFWPSLTWYLGWTMVTVGALLQLLGLF